MRMVCLGLLLAAAAWAISLAVARLKPSAAEVDSGVITRDTVKRGDLLRRVQGLGALVPEEFLHVPAPYAGRVERVHVVVGAAVSAVTLMFEMKNPEMEQLVQDAMLSLQTLESDMANLKAQVQSQQVAQRADLMNLQSQYRDAKLRNDRDQLLFKEGLELELDFRLSTNLVHDLAARIEMEQEKGTALRESLEAQIASKQTAVKQLRETLQSRRTQLSALRVHAGSAGVVEQVLVQVGQQLAPGADMAVMMQPNRLKAVLAIPEAQARSVAVGQKAEIELPDGSVSGRVSRIDPSVVNGTRNVDVSLDGPLPAGAVPDKTVDGIIEIERLRDILYVKRPTGAQDGSDAVLFRVSPDGKEAHRVRVRLGRSSIGEIEVLGGLSDGDHVIASDLSAFDGYDSIRLR